LRGKSTQQKKKKIFSPLLDFNSNIIHPLKSLFLKAAERERGAWGRINRSIERKCFPPPSLLTRRAVCAGFIISPPLPAFKKRPHCHTGEHPKGGWWWLSTTQQILQEGGRKVFFFKGKNLFASFFGYKNLPQPPFIESKKYKFNFLYLFYLHPRPDYYNWRKSDIRNWYFKNQLGFPDDVFRWR